MMVRCLAMIDPISPHEEFATGAGAGSGAGGPFAAAFKRAPWDAFAARTTFPSRFGGVGYCVL